MTELEQAQAKLADAMIEYGKVSESHDHAVAQLESAKQALKIAKRVVAAASRERMIASGVLSEALRRKGKLECAS